MSAALDPGELLDLLARSTVQQRVLRGVVLGSTGVFLLLVGLAGEHHRVLVAVGVLVALVAALAPESNAPLALVLYLGALWLVATPDRLDLWTLAAAWDLLLVHLACTLLGHGPPGTTLDPRLLRVWLARALACAAAALVVWLLAVGVGSLERPASAAAVAVALAAVVGWCVLAGLRLAGVVRRGAD
jgi:hypothetical protein